MPDSKKVFEAEVVRRGESEPDNAARDDERHVVEHVDARRIPGGGFVSQSVFSFQGDPDAMNKRLREIKLKLWLAFAGLLLIAGGCFYGAAVTNVVIIAAFLLIAGVCCLIMDLFVWVLIRAMRIATPPTDI